VEQSTVKVRVITTVIMDANFLMAPGELGIDVFEEVDSLMGGDYETVVPEPVKIELQKIARGRGEEAKAARIALELMKRNNVETMETKHIDGDSSIIELARKCESPVVATNDKNLRDQFRKRSVPTLCIRTRDHVVIEGDVR